VKNVGEPPLQELTSEQVEELCSVAEEAAREYIVSRVPLKRIEKLNISVEAEGVKPITLTIDVDVALSPLMKGFDVQRLVDDAVKEAFASAEKYLRNISCHSRK
jgi:hypothetical protein